jgi:hypothetical protein
MTTIHNISNTTFTTIITTAKKTKKNKIKKQKKTSMGHSRDSQAPSGLLGPRTDVDQLNSPLMSCSLIYFEVENLRPYHIFES